MERRTVAMLSLQSLLGKGVTCLLEADEWLHVVWVDASLANVRDRVRQLHPDVIVVTEDGLLQLDLKGLLDETGEALVISLHQRDSTMDIYHHWRVTNACSDDLRNAILVHQGGLQPSGPVVLPWRITPDRSPEEPASDAPLHEEN